MFLKKSLFYILVFFCVESTFPAILNKNNNAKDSAFLFDNFNDKNLLNAQGQTWYSFTDQSSGGNSTIDYSFEPGYSEQDKYSLHLKAVLRTGTANPYTGFNSCLSDSCKSIDMSQFSGVSLYVKGSGGSITFELMTENTRTTYNHFAYAISLSSEWEKIKIPFKELAQYWGTPTAWDPKSIYGLQIELDGHPGDSLDVWLDQIEFYYDTTKRSAQSLADSSSLIPKINQVGYLPDAIKFFTVASSVTNSGKFYIKDSLDHVVFSGKLNSSTLNDESSGEILRIGNFSSFKTPGRYHIQIGLQKSLDFEISRNVYQSLMRDALRTFYINRANVALNDPETGLSHKAAHQQDSLLAGRDLRGGWYNAGDYGKWTHEAAFAAASMMWLYELRPDIFRNLKLNIPETANALPDVLDQARWGLEWILKMQDEDGSVLHKVDTGEYFCFGREPENDSAKREAKYGSSSSDLPSSIDAASTVGVLAQAARVFAPLDSAFAIRCSKAAERSWNWLKKHRGKGQNDPYYLDLDSKQEEFWAAAEMYRLKKDKEAAAIFHELHYVGFLDIPVWQKPQLFGYLSLLNASEDLISRATLQEEFKNLSKNFMDQAQKSGYAVAMQSNEYWWGSNTQVLGKGIILAITFRLTHEKIYQDYAHLQLDYILGRNSLNHSFVTGYGARATRHPYHWTESAYSNPLPGWVSGGPNRYVDGADLPLRNLIAKGTPASKCYLDEADNKGSWASNEGATDMNAELILLTGLLLPVGSR